MISGATDRENSEYRPNGSGNSSPNTPAGGIKRREVVSNESDSVVTTPSNSSVIVCLQTHMVWEKFKGKYPTQKACWSRIAMLRPESVIIRERKYLREKGSNAIYWKLQGQQWFPDDGLIGNFRK